MEQKLMKHIDLLMERYPVLECCKNDIIDAFDLLDDTYSKEGKMLICGNGGSAADAEHMVGELMKGFKISRKLLSNEVDNLQKIDPDMGEVLAENLQGALPAITLEGHPALFTAYMNDCDPLFCSTSEWTRQTR